MTDQKNTQQRSFRSVPQKSDHDDDNKDNDKTEDGRGGVRFGAGIDVNAFDDNAILYGGSSTGKEEYVTELVDDDEDDDTNNRQTDNNAMISDEGQISYHPSTLATRGGMTSDNNGDKDDGDVDPFASTSSSRRISDRESDYQKRRHNRTILEDGLSFKETMKQSLMEKEKIELLQQLKQQQQEEGDHQHQSDNTDTLSTTATTVNETVNSNNTESSIGTDNSKQQQRRKRRWDSSGTTAPEGPPGVTAVATVTTTEIDDVTAAQVTDTESVSGRNSEWDEDVSKLSKRRKRWDETPVVASTNSLLQATPIVDSTRSGASASKWDETPVVSSSSNDVGATPVVTNSGVGASRWDATPLPPGAVVGADGMTPLSSMASNLSKAAALEREMESRNRPWTDAALDAILPSEGYSILLPPSNYIPLRTLGRNLLATPTPWNSMMTPAGFQMEIPIEQRKDTSIQEIREAYGVPLVSDEGETGKPSSNLPFIKPDDMQFFGRLMEETDEEKLSKEEAKERQIMALLLKIKSGTPPQRKTAMRQITDKARSFGAGPLFNQILPLLMSPSLEDQERHLLVKVIDRVLYKLDDLVRPYVHRILAVIEPLLIDEDYYARVEGREIISNLAKAAGLATMIATMRPDIDSPDEHVRNTTSRAFAVVASALGVPALLPFLKAVCQSRKSWQARHTGIKIVQQIALLMGVAVLPYLQELVDIVSHGLTDDVQKVKIITALTCAALAEAAHPYGIESFDSVIRPLWKGAMEQHSKALAAFLKAIGYVIPLMEENYASHYTKLVMPILLREFHSPDEEMKRIVLKVIQQCVATAGVEPDYIRKEILPEFFRNFWIRRMALDRRNYNQVIETTEELANKVGCSDIIIRIVNDLKDDSEPYRRMVMETVKRVLENLGAGDIDERLEEQLIDGMLYAFQEQAVVSSSNNALGKEGEIMLDGFGTVVNALGERCKPYLKQIAGTIKWRLNNKAASVRMQAADLIGRIALVMKACDEDQLMGHLGVVLYEYLGEEYPEVLGSILGALRAIVNVIGMTKMTPPIRDLLPRLTPILRNRHEKVQENVIDLVGRIADRGHEFVSAKEWMRICFELLEMVRAHKKAIRRAAVSTFGFIAKAIGPQDVLHTLLNNLKVQDRQMRVCTTVAIAIVSEICGPFTVLPALMNEYRVPELNVQNGVLKAMSFMFEYIGSMGKDYVYAVAPMLVDALMERDPVHRQTACATVKHLALGVAGHGCEDVLIHLLNYVWPNIFEESPHVIQAVFDAIQGLMVALGPSIIFQYTIQGLYHPARNVRMMHWRVYNCLYIYNSDALIPCYPMVEDEEENSYVRTPLQLFI